MLGNSVTGTSIHHYHRNIMARSQEARVLVAAFPGKCRYDMPLIYSIVSSLNHVYERQRKFVFQNFPVNQLMTILTSPDGKSRQNLSGQLFALKNSRWICAWASSNSCFRYAS